MLHSLSTQVSYYSNYIQSNKNWIYAGVYSDEGQTGTKSKRNAFQRMIQDAKDGKLISSLRSLFLDLHVILRRYCRRLEN